MNQDDEMIRHTHTHIAPTTLSSPQQQHLCPFVPLIMMMTMIVTVYNPQEETVTFLLQQPGGGGIVKL